MYLLFGSYLLKRPLASDVYLVVSLCQYNRHIIFNRALCFLIPIDWVVIGRHSDRFDDSFELHKSLVGGESYFCLLTWERLCVYGVVSYG